METIKEEKKADLGQLLNTLIQRGWKPRGEDKIHSCRYYEEEKKFKADYTIAGIPQVLYRSIRELCSREAGLWQFVCKNGMIKNPNIERYWKNYFELDHIEYYPSDFQYWVLESALKDENELEDFLLSNINVEGQ